MKTAIALLVALCPIMLLAQTEVTKAAPAANISNELMWYSIYGVMGVLLLVILVLGNVLVNVVKLSIEKSKVKATSILLLMFVSGALFSQNAPAVPASSPSSLVTNWNQIIAITILIVELFVVIVLILRIRLMLNELVPAKKGVTTVFSAKLPKFFDNFNASVAVEKEKDILLDHNYDGIRELDNDLPPWWKYSFIISIFWAMGYFSYYHLFGGPTSRDEYETSMRQAKEQQEEYARLNSGKVDENSVTMADAAGIGEGKLLFVANCAACHGKNAEGIVGPNLTDDYWLHGGNIKDVFKSVKFGWPAKGMKSWQTDLSPVQIKNVVSYIKSIHGTNPPNAKAPQGDLYNEGGAVKTDVSSPVTKDTAKVKSI